MKHFLAMILILTASLLCGQQKRVLENPWGDYKCLENHPPVLLAKLESGEIVQYHYSAIEPGIYETQYPELAKGLEYIGCGVLYSYNGVIQDPAFSVDQHFWREKKVWH